MNITELKELQSKIIKKNRLCNIIFIALYIPLAAFIFIKTYSANGFFPQIIFFILFLSMFFFIISLLVKQIINGKDIKIFRKEFKSIFVLTALNSNFDDLSYDPDKGFDESFIRNTAMMYTADRYYSNDYIKGKYKNIQFEQSDVHIEEKHETTDSEGHTTTTYVTIFLGRVMIFDFNKSFKANVQVASRYFGVNALPYNKKFSKVQMEDMEFNKKFTVYAENDHDAFYILTPHFMEKIKEIKTNLGCELMLGFVNNKLYIAINNNKDSFEYNVFKPIDENVINENILKDIKLITGFVDELNLDNNLFRREV